MQHRPEYPLRLLKAEGDELERPAVFGNGANWLVRAAVRKRDLPMTLGSEALAGVDTRLPAVERVARALAGHPGGVLPSR
jgi:hypothetical protein